PGVIAVRVGVDDVGDRFVSNGLDLIEDRLTVVGQLGINDDHTGLRDVNRGVSALPLNQIQVVFDFFDGLNRWKARPASTATPAAARAAFPPLSSRRTALRSEQRRGDHTAEYDDSEHKRASHSCLP